MDLMSWLFVSSVVGGLLIAVLLRVSGAPRSAGGQTDVFADRTGVGGSDVINVSAIRVAGLGGLGLVVVAFALAWTFPRIGQSVVLGAGLGVGMAAFLIWRRRRVGPLSTSSGRRGASTTLSIEQPSNVTPPRAVEPDVRGPKTVRLAADSV
jgi:hypothetical protein